MNGMMMIMTASVSGCSSSLEMEQVFARFTELNPLCFTGKSDCDDYNRASESADVAFTRMDLACNAIG
jgi:hypothetical protein